nr:MAG TPA: hypothetical protein [Bacteriophage sp.]
MANILIIFYQYEGWHIIRIILLFGRGNAAFIYYNLIHTLIIFSVYLHRALCPLHKGIGQYL